MPYIEQDVPAAGDPVRQIDAETWIDNIAFLKNSLSTSIAPAGANGSFESFDPITLYPREWTYASGTNGVGAVISTDSAHGKYCFRFTRAAGAGNTGGTLTSADFFEVSALSTGAPVAQGRNLTIQFQLKCSAAGPLVKVDILFYTRAQVAVSTVNLYSSAANPTTWTLKSATVDVPATAYYAKLRITGGDSAPDVAADVLVDDFAIFPTLDRIPQIQVFTANGNWTAPAGCTRAYVRAQGGGGGGGRLVGGGGGGGGYADGVLAVVPGTVYAVGVGAAGAGATSAPTIATDGGDSTFGALLTANGGVHGINGGAGGAGGSASAGSSLRVQLPGQAGVDGGIYNANAGGDGGAGGYGGGGGRAGGNAANGNNATSKGAGGGGGGTGSATGGNGAAGFVIVEWQ